MDLKTLTKRFGIALTGGIATGKSTLAAILRRQGYLVLDADQLSRELVQPQSAALEEIVLKFGTEILDKNGALDRAKMRELIIQDASKRRQLEIIIHPRLEAAVESELKKNNFFLQPRVWFYEAALIFERQRQADFRQVWVSSCPETIQIQRLMQRDRCSEETARKMIATQLPNSKKLEQADLVIDTDQSIEALQNEMSYLLSSLA